MGQLVVSNRWLFGLGILTKFTSNFPLLTKLTSALQGAYLVSLKNNQAPCALKIEPILSFQYYVVTVHYLLTLFFFSSLLKLELSDEQLLSWKL